LVNIHSMLSIISGLSSIFSYKNRHIMIFINSNYSRWIIVRDYISNFFKVIDHHVSGTYHGS